MQILCLANGVQQKEKEKGQAVARANQLFLDFFLSAFL